MYYVNYYLLIASLCNSRVYAELVKRSTSSLANPSCISEDSHQKTPWKPGMRRIDGRASENDEWTPRCHLYASEGNEKKIWGLDTPEQFKKAERKRTKGKRWIRIDSEGKECDINWRLATKLVLIPRSEKNKTSRYFLGLIRKRANGLDKF